MYVIFPADELVYLSYGHLIYVPLNLPQQESQASNLNSPIRLSSVVENQENPIPTNNRLQEPTSTERPFDIQRPLAQQSTVKAVSRSNSQVTKKTDQEEDSDLLKPSTSNSRSQLLSSNGYNRSERLSRRHRTASDSQTEKCVSRTSSNLSTKSFNPFVTSSSNSSNSKDNNCSSTAPVRPKRQSKNKSASSESTTTNKDRTSNYVSVTRNRSGKELAVSSENISLKRDKSPVFGFIRGKSSSPRVPKSEKVVFDYDSLFVKEQISKSSLMASTLTSLKSAVGGSSELKKNRTSSSEKALPRAKAVESESLSLLRPQDRMAGNETPLRDLIHPNYNEYLKSHNGVTFKLVRTVSDFTQQLGQMYEQHSQEMQMLVANFRKRNTDLRKERPACSSSLFHCWETLLQEIEIDSQALADIASILGRHVSRPLLEKSFYRKIESRKVFTHRESFETILVKTEEKLAKCRQEYKSAYLAYMSAPSDENLRVYFNAHNAYIQQLHATNGMVEEYGKITMPSLLQELEDIYADLCSTVTEAVIQGAEAISSKATEQCQRYERLMTQCRMVSSTSDLTHLAKSLPGPTGRIPFSRRVFVPPQPLPPPDLADGEPKDTQINDNHPPTLKDELVLDRLSTLQIAPSRNALTDEAQKLDGQIRQIQEALETLLRVQQRSVEANLFNKANEIQEDISMKRFDLYVAQLHLAAINSQKELFSSKVEGDTGPRERRTSSASTGSMKTKWMKAFKSLKTPPAESEKKNGTAITKEFLKGDPDAHHFQEYTYKKITPCDVCSQILRGHTRQGLKCRICKMNVHVDCQEKASKCQTKARLLRRQKSSSEIETRISDMNPDDEKLDEVFEMSTMNRRLSIVNHDRLSPPPFNFHHLDHREDSTVSVTDSSVRRRIFAGMKSLTGFGSRSRHGSPGHRSISLPEKRNSQDASGTRPFGQPLCIGPQIENGEDIQRPPKSHSPTPSKGRVSSSKKRTKLKN